MLSDGERAKACVDSLSDSYTWLAELDNDELRDMAEELESLRNLVLEELNERE